MRHHDDRQIGLVPKPLHRALHVGRHAGIERAERFVEQQDLRPRDQGLRHREALLHAAGKLRGIFVVGGGQGRPPSSSAARLLAPWRGASLRTGAQQRRPRQFEPSITLLQAPSGAGTPNSAETPCRDRVGLAGQRLAVDQDLAARRCLLAEQHAQEGRLAAARGADERDERVARSRGNRSRARPGRHIPSRHLTLIAS